MKKIYNLGAWLQLGSENVFKIMSSFNFDFYVIDLEHGSHNSVEVFPLIKRLDSKLYLRVSTRSSSQYKWFLDLGYDGIILSDVRSIDDVKSLIESSFFPPLGKRGVGYCARNVFGKDMSNYLDNNAKPFIGIQIESIEGINCMESILDFYGDKINVCLLGPYDLSCDIGVFGDFKNKAFLLEQDRYFNILNNYNSIGKGIHVVGTDFNEVLSCSNKGYNFIAFSTDGLLLQNSLNQINVK